MKIRCFDKNLQHQQVFNKHEVTMEPGLSWKNLKSEISENFKKVDFGPKNDPFIPF